ncbi:hypothetical protein Y032_0040g239 [Ancylostoma ceylanicum]|uniref:Cytoplasmic dynein 2 heavy chain 1 n=1 Tax=Ancylostoma ceylanicum TaxID=53326 RepID=A0A016UH66_9BILA|nr:hypothetical protein Y032_0040g239 [Ancylostoma ceylanicum]
MSKDEEKDVRRTYLLRVASHILGLNIVEEKLRQLQAIDAFCDTNATVLSVALTEQKGIDLSNATKPGTLPKVVFYKTRPTPLTTDNYKLIVNVMSMNGASNEVFLKSVQNVFSKNISESLQTTANKHLLSLVNELEENLLATVDGGKNGGEGGVVSVQDEIRLWKSRSGSTAQQYSEAFEPLQIAVDTSEDRSIDELINLVEAFEDTCDALWNSQPPYPENRMRSLIQCMGSFLCEQVSSKIDTENLWKNANVVEQLSAGIAACSQWDISVQLMTGQVWKRQMDGAWQGDAVDMRYLQGFKGRLEEVRSLKQLGPQIALLLNERGVEAEVEKTIEAAMKNTAVLAYNPFTEHNWRSRVLVAEKALDPIIDRTIPILRNRLQPSKLESNHLTADLEKYRNFLCRTKIKEKLQTERETLLTQLSGKIVEKERETDNRINNYTEQGRFLTEIAAKVVWIRQQTNKLEHMQSLCSALLDDLSGYPTLSSRMKSFMEKLKSAEQECYDQWCRETIQAIDDPTDSIALETKGRIMVLEQKRGTLNVNYSDRLIKLLKEVRQLASLGLNIPSKIINCVNQGEKFYRFGVVLKQIAHFYNTIDQQMLPCQQALLLDEAIAFERLVIPRKNEESAISRVTWEDPKELEEFIAKLQSASDKLSNHNRRLRNAHTEIVHMVLELVNLDVLKEVNRWKEILVKIRSKALQLQYQWGIESLHAQIPVIHTQLIFVQQKLQLRPPIEEIRAKYYKEMRKLLSIPEKFKGVMEGEQAGKFFATMLGKNANRFPRIYEKAEQLMATVENVDAQFADWLLLAQVDLEQLIEEKLKTASDWEAQMKMLKMKGREAEKLPNEIRLECIVVSTAGAKSAIDELLQRLFDTLTWTLRLSINTKLQKIQQFLTQAISVLSTRPQSIDEVAEANARHNEYGKTNKELKSSWAVLNEQHTLLRSVAGSGVDQMTSLTQEWEKFELMLDSHQQMIKEQVEVLKSNVDTRVKALNDESEKLFARWNQFKPKSDALQGDRKALLKAIEFIKEKRAEYDELVVSKEKLEKECDQFDVNKPDFAVLEQLGTDIQEYENNWVIFEEFNSELQTLASEEWIVFRSKTYLFDEFLQKWLEKLKASQQTHMGVRLLKDIESFREFSNCLKFCRGEVLSADHWLEMFRLLQLPRGTTLEKLTFGDLISVAPNVVTNVEQLKALNARAQGEVTIREAIQELEMWAAQVKDSQALLQSLKNSPFYAQFSDKTSIWEKRLSDLDEYLPQMNDIQRKWIYLEPIFGRGALPAEASRFARVDSEFRLILSDVVRDARLVSLCSRQSLRKSLELVIDQLNRCQKALNQFLEEKRSAFPRFYFLGDDDLLEILGQSTNPTVIQSHLKKLFQGIDKVMFGSGNETISAVLSAQGELVQLSRPVRVVAQVEMRSTLRKLCLEAIREENVDPARYPSQVLCLAEQVRFCRDCEQVLDGSRDFSKLKSALQDQLRAYTNTKVEDVVLDLKLKALILDIIHHIDVVEQLVSSNSNSTQCWTWQKQLRFYVVGDGVVARQVNSEFAYTYEYQGNTPKLVHTPLTDKCYLTLTQAMSMGLGGNPYGPAGTGKTESVKALASLFGRQVLVFNCDEGIDVHSISRIFVGIVQCGAWGCFDEFNRLDQTVLSAVSMQIQTIQDVIKSKSGTCVLGGKTATVDPNAAIFITLNPAGKGYGGRQKMPDNLKQLFRPVVMSVPDNDVIAETILYSEGFTEARTLARKIVAVFTLSKEMLSMQQHYDWGLRALKVVLRGCGDLRASKPDASETEIVVQALLLNTLSKLTSSDSKRFNVLIDDIFSTVNKEMATFGDLVEPLKTASAEMQIELTDKQLQKVFQLYEQLRQRIGVVVVGPTGAGKSTIWRVLKRAQILAGVALKTVSFNPKAMDRTKLLGHMDIDTREWSDGILTMVAREVIKDTSVHTWIIFDGDIDPEWVEALNSVLDDNRLLTMPSGERIQFGSNVNFLFETDSLQFASPATVSRMGMIFISEEDMSAKEVVVQWTKTLSDEHPDLPDWVDQHFFRCYDWCLATGLANGVGKVAALHNGLSHLRGSKCPQQFLVNLFRGLSSVIDSEKKRDFAATVFQRTPLPDMESPELVYYDSRSDSLMRYQDDIGMGVNLDDLKRDTKPFILTASAQSNRDTVLSWLSNSNRQPFIVVGPDGCGKEELLKHCFTGDSHSQLAIVHCTAQSRASAILQCLSQHCVQTSSASGRVLRPKDRAQLILYLKSLNLPAPDKYGTNEMLAFLHQLLTYQGYYDEHLDWIGLENIQITASMAPSTTHSSIPPRLVSQMRMLTIGYPSEQNLNAIYSAYLMPILEPPLGSSARVEAMASAMVRLYEEIRSNFRPTDKGHYIFTPRDLTKWTLGIMRHALSDELKVVEAVAFESKRIFKDRLAHEDHVLKFEELLAYVMPTARREADTVFVSNGTVVPSHNVTGLPLVPYGKRDYQSMLQKAVNRYEFEVANFSNALTDEMCELCAKVDRALTAPGGSLLLAGRSGLGRADAIRLVANMHQMSLFTPRITANYGQKQFDQELKNVIQTAISNSEHVVLLVEDYEILRSSFLEAISCLISSGEVPGLLAPQELDSLSTALRDQASQDGFQGHMQQYFAQRVRALLHVGLVLDTDSSEFDLKIAANPALFKLSNVIWQDSWSRNTLAQMPTLILQKKGMNVPDDTSQMFSHLETMLPPAVLSPYKYQRCIENYASIYEKKKSAISERLDRLKAGVSKLTEARQQVAEMQKKAAKKSKLLAEKQADADEALKDISKSMTGAEDQKTSMEKLRTATEEENAKIAEKKKKIEEQLKDVEPLLKEARSAVGSIKSESLSEIRSLRAPPEAIRDILQAVLLFMGILDTSWEAMRKFLSKSSVKDEIINFDAHRITRDVHKKVSALVKSKEASFDPKNAKRASVAAAPLAAWVTANLQYSEILEKISPLEQEKNELVSNLSKAEKQIQKLSKGLLTVDEKVAALKEKFEMLMKEATQIKIDLEKEQDTIKVAGTLIDRLGGEFTRWQAQMESLSKEMDNVERCALVTAAFVTYLGGCSEHTRTEVLKSFRQNFNLQDFSPVTFCATETEQLNWKNHGLPADSLSIENTVIMLNSIQTPLVIDPTGRVAAFLHSFHPKSELLRATQNDLFTQIEFGIRFGKTIIVDDVTEVDAVLVPIFRKELSSQGPRQVISFMDKQIDFHPDFKLFLCTKNQHIVIPSSIRNVLSEVNFTTTRSGLTSQLLGLAIQIEKPELEERSSALARDAEGKKMELEKLEQLLLQQLASSEENLLGNTVLLDSLNKSKENAETISRGIEESEKLRRELNDQRNAYLSLAEFASSLYFVFSDLHSHNHMYNFNVNTIISIFNRVISSCKDNTSSRIDTQMRSLQLAVFYYISRALFKADRLMFALSFVHGTLPKMFLPKEWELFTGFILDEQQASSVAISWIDESRHSAVAKLQAHLPTLYNNLQLSDQGTWNEFSRAVDCENTIPSAIEMKITPFQKVLLIQAVRPDRLYAAMQNFVLKTLSLPSINPPPFDLADILAESSNLEPILLILAGGADPSQELEELAAKTIGYHNYVSISMGQGQEQATIDGIRKATKEGQWICLNNVHLMLSIIPTIQKELAAATPHERFRLWMTTEEEGKFPAMMLQRSLKVTFEPPPGIRNNLLRTYSQIDDARRSVLTTQATFVLAWLHALLQERRTFIPQAWTKFYEFSNADVRVARVLVEALVKESKADWEFIRGLLKFVVYGGRIENVFDSKVLESYLLTLFTPEKITGRSGQLLAKGVELIAVDNIKEIQNFITTTIPSEDDPNLFGLPANIKFSWQLTEAEDTIARMRMAVTTTTANERSSWAETCNPILHHWKRLCQGGDLHSRQIPPPKESSDPIAEVMSLEFIHAIKIVQKIHACLSLISKSIRGTVTPDKSTLEVIKSLQLHQTPDLWHDLWSGPREPAEYLTTLVYKAKSVQELVSLSEQKEFLGTPLNFSKLFRPGRLLNALRQVTARAKGCTMDVLRLSSAWDASQFHDDVTIHVQGILLQGALFDGQLRSTLVSSPPVTSAPQLTLGWTQIVSTHTTCWYR